ncbi:HEPN domain-containing protein [Gordonia westfalica]|uniref:ApeA N-terminal domain-containing protein n=1 Tax=Gordonia westfalica TaxID=158898 RepID=A0A1H2GNS8_9ACTN|nr:HEPN domain-containing protein [Gordonia westfalica]SDU21129.1 hypothetical protein SAMN04488548_13423 [Gordonia westfalica]
MDKKLREALVGTMGHFWTSLQDFPESETGRPGHGSKVGPHYAVRTMKTAEEGWRLDHERQYPAAVVGATEQGGFLAYDIRDMPENSIFGGGATTPVKSYHARAIVVGIDPFDLASTDLLAISATFPGVIEWCGAKAVVAKTKKGSDGKPESATFELRKIHPVTAKLKRGASVEIGVPWKARGIDAEGFIGAAPLQFTVEYERAKNWYDLINPVANFQALLSLAYDNLVLAGEGTAVIEANANEDPSNKGKLWSSALMEVPRGVSEPAERRSWPSFYLATIGGMPGVARWIRLCAEYPRATYPLTNKYSIGTGTVEIEMINISVAIEYWVGSCKRNGRPKWTKSGGKNHALTLARHVGSEFATFVGDIDKWAELFWNRYNALKHQPGIKYDAYEMSYLMRTGRILLMCALLNRVSSTKSPTKSICSSHMHDSLGHRIRELLDSNPTLFEGW